MKRLMPLLFAAYLTLGQNHGFKLGNGDSLGLEINQPLTSTLSLNPSATIDNNQGFKDRAANVDLAWSPVSRITFIMGTGYDKYTLLNTDPTEDTNIHTAVRIKVW